MDSPSRRRLSRFRHTVSNPQLTTIHRNYTKQAIAKLQKEEKILRPQTANAAVSFADTRIKPLCTDSGIVKVRTLSANSSRSFGHMSSRPKSVGKMRQEISTCDTQDIHRYEADGNQRFSGSGQQHSQPEVSRRSSARCCSAKSSTTYRSEPVSERVTQIHIEGRGKHNMTPAESLSAILTTRGKLCRFSLYPDYNPHRYYLKEKKAQAQSNGKKYLEIKHMFLLKEKGCMLKHNGDTNQRPSIAEESIRRVRAQSCRRRSAKLTEEQRSSILAKLAKTPTEKIEDYYKLQIRNKAQQLSKAKRKQLAQARFRRAVWTVRWIIRWKHLMIDISLDKLVMTAMELDWHTRNTDGEENQFRKEDFSRSRISTRVPIWAKKILRKPPDWRSETECNKLHALLRPLRSFEKFTETIQHAMCKSMTYQRVEAKRLILRRGHAGHCFYFIYSGSVFINIDDTNSQGEKFTRTTAVLYSGESFGELALLRDSVRAASITCREDCELLSVDKDIFARICPAIFVTELSEKQKFLSTLPLFGSNLWKKESIEALCIEAQIKKYKSGKVVVADNTNDDWIYICMEGQCSVIRTIKLPTPHDEMIAPERLRELAQTTDDTEKPSFFSTLDSVPSVKVPLSNAEDGNSKQNITQDQLLHSMAVEWLRAHEQPQSSDTLFVLWIEEVKRRNRLDAQAENEEFSGMKTFTSFKSQRIEAAKEEGLELAFIHIARVVPQQLFDIQVLIKSAECGHQLGSQLTLVSDGAKMLRIKRTDFFKYATLEALLYIKSMTADEGYPNEVELFERFQELNRWSRFKSGVVESQICAPTRKSSKRLTQARTSTRNEKIYQTLMLNAQQAQALTDNLDDKERHESFLDAIDRADRDADFHLGDAWKLKLKNAQTQESTPFQRIRRSSATGTLPSFVQKLVQSQPAQPVNTHHNHVIMRETQVV